MSVHPVLFAISVALIIYLVVVVIRMHQRNKRLEKTVRKLEGTNGVEEEHHRWDKKEDLS